MLLPVLLNHDLILMDVAAWLSTLCQAQCQPYGVFFNLFDNSDVMSKQFPAGKGLLCFDFCLSVCFLFSIGKLVDLMRTAGGNPKRKKKKHQVYR